MAAPIIALALALEDEATETPEPTATSESTTESPLVVNVESTDYTEYLDEILSILNETRELHIEQHYAYMEQAEATQVQTTATRVYTEYLAGFGLFVVVVLLCRYVYKLFRMFF